MTDAEIAETPQEWFARKVEEYKDDPEYLRAQLEIEHGEVLAAEARIAELEAALGEIYALLSNYRHGKAKACAAAALKGDADAG